MGRERERERGTEGCPLERMGEKGWFWLGLTFEFGDIINRSSSPSSKARSGRLHSQDGDTGTGPRSLGARA